MTDKPDIAGWIMDGKVFYSTNAFNGPEFHDEYEYLKKKVIGIVKSKFSDVSITGAARENEPCIIALAVYEPTTIVVDGESTDVPPMTLVAFYNSLDYYIQESAGCVKFRFIYADKVDHIGDGSKKFEVVAKINDEYRIKVFAETEEEAIALAYNHDISEWEHPTIEPHLEDRRIIRHARWGNLTAKEME